MLASLNHPNICSIHGFEESDGVRFLILELVEGDTLSVLLANRQGPCLLEKPWHLRAASPTRLKSHTRRASSIAI